MKIDTELQNTARDERLHEAGVVAAEVVSRIEAALHQAAVNAASRIRVEAIDGRVVLRGSVRSWAERNDVERAAWAAPGVTGVEDHVQVDL